MIPTADQLLTLYRHLDPEQRRRFHQALDRDLDSPYHRCRRIRRQRLERRHFLLEQIIQKQQLPAATLEDWRRIAQELQLNAWHLATRRQPPSRLTREPANPCPRLWPWVSARALRSAYLRQRQTQARRISAAA